MGLMQIVLKKQPRCLFKRWLGFFWGSGGEKWKRNFWLYVRCQ